ncbi:formylglycine-generating enzyme family protein [Verrucomicrobia bacterium]|nr:formylglycine-generating enzyme family protein [Verrucomicrobiota bacterium]MDA7657909.1 formylglycine-generating enzyme family protein [Verrucomicrobiota bacterium]
MQTRKSNYITVLGLLMTLSTLATEIGQATLKLVEGKLVLDYHLNEAEGLVSLYHSSDLQEPRDVWDFLTLRPITDSREGSFILNTHVSRSSDIGFFEYRTTPFLSDETMVWIQPGSVKLGSPDSESGRFLDEGPQHQVEIEHGYWLSKHEVTQSEFENIMGFNPSRAAGSPKAPVETVTWFEAVTYCQRLTEQARNSNSLPDGYEYRLPTEAEWEYACRAGTETAYSFGDDAKDLSLYGWWSNNSGATPSQVGLLRPNPWGLYDMHGNVFEWCLTEYKAYPGGEIRSLKIDYRAIRSGAFICPLEILRSACRFESAPSKSGSWLTGFRVALAPVHVLPAEIFLSQ